VREHRTKGRGPAARSTGFVGDIVVAAVLPLWTKVARRPVDSVAILGAAAATIVISVNAVFLQSGPHPAPFFVNPASQPRQAAETHPITAAPVMLKPADLPPPRPTVSQRQGQPVSVRRNDPIGDLIGSSVGSPSRIMAVQRLLSDFGYGQIKPTGTLDEPTSTAIERFEREHKLPVTGRLSDRVLAELAAMTGRPIE
jgi:Putative peptidoglycan binding domain